MFSRKTLYVLLIAPIIIFVAIYFILKQPTIDILADESFTKELLTEPQEAKLCTSSLYKENGHYIFTYTLSKDFTHPYSGISIRENDYKAFSLNNYKLDMEIKSDKNLPLVIRINKFMKGYSDENKWETYLLASKTESISKGENRISIKSKDINEIPNWWYSINQSWVNKEIEFDQDDIKAISIICENGAPIGEETHLVFERFRLVYDASSLWVYLFLAIPYYALILLLFLFKKNGKVKYVFMPIKEVNAKERIQASSADVLTYIGENYQNPDLKITDVANHLKLSETETANLIKEYCDKTFRQYLNQIRMEEAKRLLKETNQQISSIAFMVGYNNVQHFNRVFKEYTGIPPTLFREDTSDVPETNEVEKEKEK